MDQTTPIPRRRLGKTDLAVSSVGFGAGEIGYEKTPVETVARILGAALDRGVNLIDSAECYLISEELLGAAISRRRGEFHLMTKCGHNADLPFDDWEPALIPRSIERSLRRLRTDYVDVVHLHSCSLEALRQGDLIAALQKARDAGKTRYIGYSGDGDAALWAISSGAFDTLMVSVNVADQAAIDKVLPAAATAGIGVIAKRSIANGIWAKRAQNPYWQTYRARCRELDYDFFRDMSPRAIETALRFTLSTAVDTALVGSTDAAHFLEAIEVASRGALAPAEFNSIRERWNAVARADWVGQS